MGTAFLYGNGGSGGTCATLTVTAPAGATVTVSKDGKKKTKVAGAGGLAVFKGLATGAWTVSISDGEQTAQKTVTITADYSTAITFFSAIIHITYPKGSTCTATDGVTTLTAPNTSGTWDCVVPNAGTWTVMVANKGWSDDAKITKDKQIVTIDLSKYYLFNGGSEYLHHTGGWKSKGVVVNESSWTATAPEKKISNVMRQRLSVSAIGNYSGILVTTNPIDLSNFNTLRIQCDTVSSSTATRYGSMFALAILKSNVISGYFDDFYTASKTVVENTSAYTATDVAAKMDVSGLSGNYYIALVTTTTPSGASVFYADIAEILLE